MKENIPVPQQIYRHFKGNLYQILSLAEHTETGEQLVIYQAMYGDFKVYARELRMFMEKLDSETYPDALQKRRFELVESKGEAEGQSEDKKDSEVKETSAKKEIDVQKSMEDKAEEAWNLDPMVVQFLDARTYEEKLEILSGLHHRITDDMINTMALAVDIEVKEGDIEERYLELRKSLMLYNRFECTRLR